MRWRTFAVFMAMMGCGAQAPSSDFDNDKRPTGSEGGFGDSNGGLGGATPGGASDGCADNARLVYVVSEQYDLFSFRPDKLAFTKIGRLECPAFGATPNSMAIDRAGAAWVNYSDGSLFKVSTTDARCETTTFEAGQEGFFKFGMAFATNAAGSQDETLYVSGLVDDGPGLGLATVDLKTFKLTPLGQYSGELAGRGAELTGTGDGRLFGFFTTAPNATLAQIDKSRGATSADQALEGVNTGNAWAFSFWGGDFWFYTSPVGATTSQVTQLKASANNEIQVAKPAVDFRIVGAGVSTCAPTAPPR